MERMHIPTSIAQIEQAARAAGLSVDQFCERAEVDRATWQRWKAGTTTPRLDKWMRVQSVAASLPSAAA